MSSPIAEIVHFPSDSSLKIASDAHGEGRKIWTRILETIAAQPGFKKHYWGMYVEQPDELQLVVEWNSLADHETFQASSVYPSMIRDFETIATGPLQMQHARLDANLEAVTSGATAVTELLIVYLPKDYAVADFNSTYRAFADGLRSDAAVGSKQVTGGWVVEAMEHSKLGDEKGRAFLMVVGWESLDRHQAYRETEKFNETIVGFREKATAMEMHHVEFVKG